MYLTIIYVGQITNFLITLILQIRQYKVVKNAQVPDFFKDKITKEEYEKTKKYNLEKLQFSIFCLIFSFIQMLITLKFEILQKIYFKVTQIFSFTNEMSYANQIIFLIVINIISTFLFLPFSLYSTFSIEERYGFNKTTKKLFFTDLIKSTIITNIVIAFVIYITLFSINYFNNWHYKLMIFMAIFQIFMIVVMQVYIMPLFNKFEIMEDGNLKNRVIELAKKVGFKYSNIFVMDGSKRSSHSNAFFIGLFGEKRIVFYDTLIKQVSENETIAIFAHELGHWYHLHLPKMLIVQIIQQFIYLYILQIMLENKNFINSVFRTQHVPMIMKLTYFGMISGILSPFLLYLVNLSSRRNEKQADSFAVEKGYAEDLEKGLISLHVENKSCLSNDWMYSTYFHSHPTLLERIAFIRRESAKRK